MTAGGGVLDAIDDACHALNTRETRDERNALIAARIAIAELIAADKAFDLSRAALIEVSNRITAGSRSDDDFRKQANAQHSYDRATARRASALAALEQQP